MCEEYCKNGQEGLCDVVADIKNSTNKGNNTENKEDCVSNPNPSFTHTFAEIGKLTEISRYGNNAIYNPGAQARNYVVVMEGESTAVYAPTNITITRIHYSDKKYTKDNTEYIRPEYRINFDVSCEVEAAYDHIVSLSDKLKAYAPQESAPGRNDGVAVSINLEAGEIMGYTSGGFPGRAFDFVFLNHAKKAEHINPDRWTTDNSLYMGCPFDYFADDLKSQYIGLIPEIRGVRDCGPAFREVAGTPEGYWFQGNATENYGKRFSLSDGVHFIEWTLINSDEPLKKYRTNDAVRIDPETITEGKSVCYFDPDASVYVFLKMLPDDKLGIVSGSGMCPSVFPDGYEVWER